MWLCRSVLVSLGFLGLKEAGNPSLVQNPPFVGGTAVWEAGSHAAGHWP